MASNKGGKPHVTRPPGPCPTPTPTLSPGQASSAHTRVQQRLQVSSSGALPPTHPPNSGKSLSPQVICRPPSAHPHPEAQAQHRMGGGGAVPTGLSSWSGTSLSVHMSLHTLSAANHSCKSLPSRAGACDYFLACPGPPGVPDRHGCSRRTSFPNWMAGLLGDTPHCSFACTASLHCHLSAALLVSGPWEDRAPRPEDTAAPAPRASLSFLPQQEWPWQKAAQGLPLFSASKPQTREGPEGCHPGSQVWWAVHTWPRPPAWSLSISSCHKSLTQAEQRGLSQWPGDLGAAPP